MPTPAPAPRLETYDPAAVWDRLPAALQRIIGIAALINEAGVSLQDMDGQSPVETQRLVVGRRVSVAATAALQDLFDSVFFHSLRGKEPLLKAIAVPQCDGCGLTEDEANQENISWHTRQPHLCAECARRAGLAPPPRVPFGELLRDVRMSARPERIEQPTAAPQVAEPKTDSPRVYTNAEVVGIVAATKSAPTPIKPPMVPRPPQLVTLEPRRQEPSKLTDQLPKHQVWRAAFHELGEEPQPPKLMGTWKAETFEAACRMMLDGMPGFDSAHLTLTGLKLYPSRQHALRVVKA